MRRSALPALVTCAAALPLLFAACAGGHHQPASFTSSVAAFDAGPDSAVLWTRVDREATLTLEVAADESFADIAFQQQARALDATDDTAQAYASGLAPATQYYYRFRDGHALSPVGTFRTAPAADDGGPLRFIFSGGTTNAGPPEPATYSALSTALAEEPDFFLYVGDTIAPGGDSLDAFRSLYRENRSVAPLASLLATTSTFAIWDANETGAPFAGTPVSPDLLAAAQQAYREYLPTAADESNVLYRRVRWGSAVELFILDTRSFRDDTVAAACTPPGSDTPDVLPGIGAPTVPEAYRALRTAVGLPAATDVDCLNALSNPARSLLGEQQRQWLLAALESSDATFKFIVSPAPIGELIVQPYDRWEGYRAERDFLLRDIASRGIENVVFLTTGLEGALIDDVRVDLASPAVAVEAAAGPVGGQTLGDAIAAGQGTQTTAIYEQLFQQVARVSCTALDAYSYGLVEVDPAAGAATITLKDENGGELCRTTVRAAGR